MFNEKGEVIGIVSAILTQTGGFQGIGFATSSNIARKLLIEERVFWFGVEGFLLTDFMAQIFNLPQSGGILVQKVVSHSPAGAMGVKGGSYKAQIEGQNLLLGGDIIISFAGVKLDCETSLIEGRKRMSSLKTKDAYTLTVFRNGQVVELQSVVP
jgi:S1-C subfamily serine protease